MWRWPAWKERLASRWPRSARRCTRSTTRPRRPWLSSMPISGPKPGEATAAPSARECDVPRHPFPHIREIAGGEPGGGRQLGIQAVRGLDEAVAASGEHMDGPQGVAVGRELGDADVNRNLAIELSVDPEHRNVERCQRRGRVVARSAGCLPDRSVDDGLRLRRDVLRVTAEPGVDALLVGR